MYTHLIGVIFFLIAYPILFFTSGFNNDIGLIVTLSLFGLGMILSYSSSCIYHAEKNPNLKKKKRVFDHISIFLLIGGTYAPIVYLFTPKETAIWFLILQWSIIFIGILFKLFFTGKFQIISVILYLALGWMVLLILEPLKHIPSHLFFWLLAGGISYTVGILFYVNKKMLYSHTIWHLFVLFGTIAHYIFVYKSLS